MKQLLAGVLAAAATAVSASSSIWHETFEDSAALKRWIASEDARYEGSKWDFSNGTARVDAVPKFYGLSRLLDSPILPGDADGFVIQYEVAHEKGVTCSGAYLKLLVDDEGFQPAQLREQSPYSIMFGPDNCGNTHKVHLIFRQRNPVTGEWQEKHMATKVAPPTDKLPHLYTLELRPDNSFAVKIDGETKASGSLLSDADFEPPFAAPREIDDPEDTKPEDWVDEAKIPDPDAVKPDDWDENAPRTIPDPDAVKPEGWLDDEPLQVADPDASEPEDWSEDDDGVWEAPLVDNPKCAAAPGCGEWKPPTIANPAYKGKWTRPLIDNPAYKGAWAPRRIPNPGFFEEPDPVRSLAAVGAVAVEILANDAGIAFDNVMIGSDVAAAQAWAENDFLQKQEEVRSANEAGAREAEAEKRRKAYEKGGFQDAVLFWAGEAQDKAVALWRQAPVLLVSLSVGVVAALALLVGRCCGMGSGDELQEELAAAARHKKDDDEDGEDEDVDVDKEGLDLNEKVPGEEADEADEDEDDDDDDNDDDEVDGKKGAALRRRPVRAT